MKVCKVFLVLDLQRPRGREAHKAHQVAGFNKLRTTFCLDLQVVKGKYIRLQKARIKDINLHIHSQQDRSMSEVAQRGNLWADKRGPEMSYLTVEEYAPGPHCSNGAKGRVQGEQNLDKGMKASYSPKGPPKLSIYSQFCIQWVRQSVCLTQSLSLLFFLSPSLLQH